MRPEYKTVFVLFHEQGQPYEEMAETLGRPVGTIKTWLHRARLEIIDRLRRRGMIGADNTAGDDECIDPARNPLADRRGK